MAQAARNLDVFGNDANVKILSNVNTIASACVAIGGRYLLDWGYSTGLYKDVSGIMGEIFLEQCER
jgi:hypothetical protein